MKETPLKPRERILFYTRPCYLDAALEYIRLVKDRYDLVVVIQLSESELKSNILDLNIDINQFSGIVDYEFVENSWGLEYLAEYFKGCKVVFALFKNGLYNTVKQSVTLIKFIQSVKPDYLHFDDFTGKQAILAPYLWVKRAKLVLNIHDPKPHSGEFTFNRQLLQSFLYRLPKKLVFFSKFSLELGPRFRNQRSFCVKLLPYTVFRHFHSAALEGVNREYISFVGRISKYKGVDLFLDSIQIITKKFPTQKFLIAGKTLFGYKLNNMVVEALKDNLTVVEKHLSNNEMVDFISKSRVVVCPYLDATQSGVILTSYALNTPVIVTNVGGLSEYVEQSAFGSVTKSISAEDLATEVIRFLEDANQGKSIHTNTFSDYFEHDRTNNLRTYSLIYSG